VDADQTLTDLDRALEDPSRTFLADARTATLATIGPTGRPRLVPICFVLGADDPAGRVRLYSPLDEKPKSGADPHGLARVRDLLARPEATLLVDRWSEDWDRLAWLRLETRADLLEPGPREAAGGAQPDRERTREHGAAIVALRAKYPQYAGHRLEDRPILRFTVERTVGWGALGD
jgi:PPOX class probable F420-dependent enzyme